VVSLVSLSISLSTTPPLYLAWEIVKPQDLNAVIKTMDDKGLKGLKIKERKA
jgi:hypothetical protein